MGFDIDSLAYIGPTVLAPKMCEYTQFSLTASFDD